MVAYPYQMPSGIAGSITRPEYAIIEAQMLNQSTPPTAFGVAVKMVSGVLLPIGSGDVSNSIYGVLVRPYPTSGNGTDGLGVAVPNKAFPADVLKRGYINVIVNNFASVPPTKDSPVYVRVGNGSTNKVVGNFEAAPELVVTGVAGTNTGNGTIGSLGGSQTWALNTAAGTYKATFTTATAYNVTDSTGSIIATGVASGTPTAFVAENGLTGKITTGGVAFVAGDSFTITVTANTILYGSINTYYTGATDAYGNGEIGIAI